MSNTIKKATISKKHQFIDKSRPVSEVLDIIRGTETKEEKVALLKAYETKGLKYLINGTYNVDWSDVKVPKFEFNTRPAAVCNMNLHKAIPRLEAAYNYRYKNPNVTEKNLIIVLEEMSSGDAELVYNMLSGKKIEGISKTVLKEAYPEFFLD